MYIFGGKARSHSNIAEVSTNPPQANGTAKEPEGDPSDDKDEKEVNKLAMHTI